MPLRLISTLWSFSFLHSLLLRHPIRLSSFVNVTLYEYAGGAIGTGLSLGHHVHSPFSSSPNLLKFGSGKSFPNQTALNMADIYWHRRQLDSCFYFLQKSMALYRLNLANPVFGQDLRDEYYLKNYYDVGRKYYRAVNEPSKAYAYADSLTILVDRITKRYNSRQHLADSILLTNEDWDEFRRRFERVHPGFFWQLKSQFNELSPAEERLLALSKLRLDTRQMSCMLGIAPNSIRTTKYRLRKKLGVSGNSPLLELLVEPKE